MKLEHKRITLNRKSMYYNNKRIMISAVKSGSGKTTVSLALLKALKNRGLKLRSFKCGPDYIDPMLHRSVLGIPCANLDPFFQDRELMRCLFCEKSREADISVIEGVMGYYDGISFDSTDKSSYECAYYLGCPVILVIDGRGMSHSLIALLKGMQSLKYDSGIRGVIINNVPERIYNKLKSVIERETDIVPLGFMPHIAECEIDSRHLGLLTPDDIPEFEKKTAVLGREAESCLDIDAILRLSAEGRSFEYDENHTLNIIASLNTGDISGLRIAVARDEAFSFIYEDNLELMEHLGAEIVFFSPLRDAELPDNIDGCIFYGGYPELYASGLSKNKSMLFSVRKALSEGLPALAECGGFLYLHEYIEDPDGREYAMTGFFNGSRAIKRDRLQHFGYVDLKPYKDDPFIKKGTVLKAHEFHYYVSSLREEHMEICKASDSSIRYKGMLTKNNVLCGFPHFYYYADPSLILNFLKLCRKQGLYDQNSL